MSGAGLGSALGTGAGVLLAPESLGLSLAVPAALGATGGALGGKLSGQDPLISGLMGGVSGLIGGASLGGQDATGLFGDVARQAEVAKDVAAEGASSAASGLASEAASGAASGINSLADVHSLVGNLAQNTGQQAAQQAGQQVAQQGAQQVAQQAAKTSLFQDPLKWVGENPLTSLGALTGLASVLQPQQHTSLANSFAANQALHPGFYASLPNYNYQSSYTAPSGDWYSYGQRPQSPLVRSSVTPAAHGGLMKKYAHGGMVQYFAMGGQPMPMAQSQAPQPMAVPQSPLAGGQSQSSPIDSNQTFNLGKQLGQKLRQHIINQAVFSKDGQVTGPGKGQDDAVPAKLSQDEYVLPADIVSHLGDGSSNAGGKVLDHMVHKIRAHKAKAGAGFPPKAKNPLSYIKGGV